MSFSPHGAEQKNGNNCSANIIIEPLNMGMKSCIFPVKPLADSRAPPVEGGLFRRFKSQSHQLQRPTGDDINSGVTGSPNPKTPPAGLNLAQNFCSRFPLQEAPTWSRFIPLTRRRLAESLKREGRGSAQAFGNHVGSSRGLQNSKW